MSTLWRAAMPPVLVFLVWLGVTPLSSVVLGSNAEVRSRRQTTAYVKLVLNSTSPAVLDSPIRFVAELVTTDDTEPLQGPFVFRWSDNASPAHWKEEETEDHKAEWTLTYSSKEYEARTYTMTVIVFNFVAIFREEVATESTVFRITKELNGELQVNGRGKQKSNMVVSTQNVTHIVAELYDPLGYLAGSKVNHYWFVNDTNFGLTKNTEFTYHFDTPGECRVEVMVVAFLPNKTTARNSIDYDMSAVSGVWDDPSKSPTSIRRGGPPPPGVKFGIFRRHLYAKTPLASVNVTGRTWLKHGQLLELTVSCDGSGPWTYCWSIENKDYNVTGNETCRLKDGDTIEEGAEALLDTCQFPIIWYFREPGSYDILLIVANDLVTERRLIHVNIYEVHSQLPITLVVLPIVSSVLAVMVVAAGIFAFFKFKRDLSSVETADFDFNPREEQLEYKTFWERLRDSMVNAFQTSSDTISHVSSVSSRSSQHNAGASIHYGSIT